MWKLYVVGYFVIGLFAAAVHRRYGVYWGESDSVLAVIGWPLAAIVWGVDRFALLLAKFFFNYH